MVALFQEKAGLDGSIENGKYRNCKYLHFQITNKKAVAYNKAQGQVRYSKEPCGTEAAWTSAVVRRLNWTEHIHPTCNNQQDNARSRHRLPEPLDTCQSTSR